jgi:hypothetical protein
MLLEAGQRLGLARTLARAVARRPARLPVRARRRRRAPPATRRSAASQLVFSSLMLQWCDDLGARARRAASRAAAGRTAAVQQFRPGRRCSELRAAWAAVDDAPHVNRFRRHARPRQCADARRAGAAGAGRTDRTNCEYDTPLELMRDLQRIGANNVARGPAPRAHRAARARRGGRRLPERNSGAADGRCLPPTRWCTAWPGPQRRSERPARRPARPARRRSIAIDAAQRARPSPRASAMNAARRLRHRHRHRHRQDILGQSAWSQAAVARGVGALA